MTNDFLQEIEFFRDAFVLVPKKGVANVSTVLLPSFGKKKHRLFCACSTGKDPKCSHATQLTKHVADFSAFTGVSNVEQLFDRSLFRFLSASISRVQNDLLAQISVIESGNNDATLVIRSSRQPLIEYVSAGADRERLRSRIDEQKKFSRGWLLNRTATFVETEYERAMRVSGHKTVRMAEEAGLWYRFAYHCFMEFRPEDLHWSMAVSAHDGTVTLAASQKSSLQFRIFLPGRTIAGVIDILRKADAAMAPALIDDDEHELLFRFESAKNGMVQIVPGIERCNEGKTVFSPVDSRFCYGSLGYLPEIERFFKFTHASLQRIATGWHTSKTIPETSVSSFIAENMAVLSIGSTIETTEGGINQLDLFGTREADDLKRIALPPIITSFDRIELRPQSCKSGQWTIAIVYCTDSIKVNLSHLIDAHKNRSAYCFTGHSIVAMKSSDVINALAQARGIGADGMVSLSNMSLMLLRGSFVSLQFDGDQKLIKKMKELFSGKPRKDPVLPQDLHCTLRSYQQNGVAWLLFLYDYYMGGLLCDEMGLGKTIQVISTISMLKAQHPSITACIVCPTSVISHWMHLVARFAPSLRIVDYTKTRKIPLKSTYDILLMSYGIMRNDIEIFEQRTFDLVIFDEIQQLKNSDTAGYRAACRFKARSMIGLTGTPVENSAEDLQALFHLVLPGLTIDIPSETALLQAVTSTSDTTTEISRFRKRIEPFILRRCKADVLTDLPLKIEENRFCDLSTYQQELYREVLRSRATPLIETLKSDKEPIPYMHIFSLMTYLKQLCNSPALALGTWSDYTLYESGKWELFKELLDESIGSGEKVVVFTQFLGMVDIFSHYLETLRIDYETLTGKTTNRHAHIERFANDKNCRVFIGSLKAGGVGIDLVAASVVIHYDRWWNAAREDQATDRVHRIGQTRGVQVFKLITQHTLEEQIDLIIERKKNIAQLTLSEDDPDTVKHFTRDELIELLSGQ